MKAAVMSCCKPSDFDAYNDALCQQYSSSLLDAMHAPIHAFYMLSGDATLITAWIKREASHIAYSLSISSIFNPVFNTPPR